MTIFADQYDFAISLLLLPDESRVWHGEGDEGDEGDEEDEEDVSDRFSRKV